MEFSSTFEVIVGAVASLGGLSLIKFLFFMRPERRKASAEAELKELEADEKELNVMKSLVESLQQRIEQQDKKISELSARIDALYAEKHELEKVNNELVREANELRLQLMEAQHNLCVRPDDECLKRMPPREHCRLKRLANGYYDKYYDKGQLEQAESELDEEEKEIQGKETGKDGDA